MIKLLDCTLRDGGYINDWNFKEDVICNVINKLIDSNVDIIECGYIENCSYSKDRSKYNSIDEIKCYVPSNKHNSEIVAMIDFGKYEVNDIPVNDNTVISGIRVVFHKKDAKEALEFCRELNKKGYKLFIQPMVTMSYTDEEILDLIKKINEIKPYAFYLVDSFGVMQKKDLVRLIHLVDNNLDNSISLGYHSHNNLQLAYSNAQCMLDIKMNRDVIIDSSIFGMGRGAGNLNTELFADYLNRNMNKNYRIEPLLDVIDENLNTIYNENYWGYSLPHYLSAKNNCHPNYATYLSSKYTLSVKSIDEVLKSIDTDKKCSFNKEYTEALYKRYQEKYVDDKVCIDQLKKELDNHEILIIAPGKSVLQYEDTIRCYIEKQNPIIFSVNYIPDNFTPNYLFCSNGKRYEKLRKNANLDHKNIKLIFTSNVDLKGDSYNYIVNYSSLLGQIKDTADNVTIMLMNLLSQIKCNNVKIAGFDGFNADNTLNYVDEYMNTVLSKADITKRNECITSEMSIFQKNMEVTFITPSIYNK